MKQITQVTETIPVGIKVADELLKFCQAQLEKLTHASVIDKVKLMTGNTQISTRMK